MSIKPGRLILCLALPLIILSACNQSNQNLEQAKEQLNRDGLVFTNNVETASKLTGYPVKTPSYVPEGYSLAAFPEGSFQVFRLGVTDIPIKTDSPEFPYSVLQYFYKSGKIVSNEPFFSIDQSRNQISGPGEEPVTINGFQGKKGIFNENSRAMIYISWNDGTTSFVLTSWLTDTLDELTLLRIAASMHE